MSGEDVTRCEDAHRVVCAWCQKVTREGHEPVSHGICESCEQKMNDEIDGEPAAGAALNPTEKPR